jgi:iron complex outermembrane receptor protein
VTPCNLRIVNFKTLRAMQKMLLTTVLTLLLKSVAAQFTISGTVKDKNTGQALPGASIQVENTYLATQSNADGSFRFKGLKNGNYFLSISFIGYEKIKGYSVNVTNDVEVNITLTPSAFLADEVVITSTRANANSGLAYTELSKEEIAKQNFGQDLPFLLNLQPSVVVNSDAGAGVGYTGIRVRGSDPTRINVTMNGIPVNDAESHGVFWVNMPDFASSVSSIQVQRGVGTSTNGSGAFGATVNLQTNELNDKAYAETQTGIGSFNTWRNTLKVGTGLINEKYVFDARLSKISSDGYIDRASADLRSFYLSGARYGEKSILRANVFSGREITYQAWYGVPQDSIATNRTYNEAGLYFDENGNPLFYDNEVDNYQQDHYQLFYTYEFNRKLTANVALHYTRGRGYYEQYRYNERFSRYGLANVEIGETTITRTNLIRRRWLDNDFYGTVFSLQYVPNNKLDLILGGGYNIYDGDHFGEIIWARHAQNIPQGLRYYDNNALKKDFNVYAKANYRATQKLSLFLDLQVRTIDYTFFGFDNDLNNTTQQADLFFFNPKAGMSYNFNPKHEAYASFGVANREPVRRDFTESTPESRPSHETLYNLETGYRYKGKSTGITANVYYMYYENQLVLTGSINDVGAYNRVNTPESYRAGIELELKQRILPKLDLAGNISLSENKIRSFTEFIDDWDTGEQISVERSNTDIAFSPALISAAILSYRPIKGLEISILSKYVGKQYLDNTQSDDRSLDAFWVQDLRIGYTFKGLGMREIGLNFLLNNFTNVMYAPNGYTFSGVIDGQRNDFNYLFPQAGINWLTNLVVKF